MECRLGIQLHLPQHASRTQKDPKARKQEEHQEAQQGKAVGNFRIDYNSRDRDKRPFRHIELDGDVADVVRRNNAGHITRIL